jgi:uncharacterized protein YjlB
MGLVEDVKKLAERATGIGLPSRGAVEGAVRARKPQRYRFRHAGLVPNHPRWPLIHYRSPVRLPDKVDPAALFEQLFARHGWRDSWRNGVYDYLHYHSGIHEVMGVARGAAVVQFGGKSGRRLRVKAGDVVVLPAGTGHQCLSMTKDFLVVGAYPAAGVYDVCEPTDEALRKAIKTIARVPPPRKDPVYGTTGPLTNLWRKSSRR